jgi:hypothetical protein
VSIVSSLLASSASSLLASSSRRALRSLGMDHHRRPAAPHLWQQAAQEGDRGVLITPANQQHLIFTCKQLEEGIKCSGVHVSSLFSSSASSSTASSLRRQGVQMSMYLPPLIDQQHLIFAGKQLKEGFEEFGHGSPPPTSSASFYCASCLRRG